MSGRRPGLRTAIVAHALMRIASSAGGVLVGVWLASLQGRGVPIRASLVGALAACAFGAEMLGSVPLGMAADAVPVRGLMSAGALAGGAATALFGVGVLIPLFFLSRLLEGLGVAAVTPPLLRSLACATAGSASRRARMMSWFELSLLAGLALGGLAGTQLWVHAGRRAFGLLALVYGFSALLLFLSGTGSGPVRVAGRGAMLRGLRHALSDARVRALAPIWICVNAIIGIWLGPTLSFVLTQPRSGRQYLDGIFAGAPADIGWLLLAYTAVFAAGVSIWARVLPKSGARRAMRISMSAMIAVCLALAALNHSAPWPAWARWVLLGLTGVLIMIESGFGPAALSWLAEALGLELGVGAAMGVYSLLLGTGALTGALLAGWVATLWRVDGLLAATAALAVAALLLLARLPVSAALAGVRRIGPEHARA